MTLVMLAIVPLLAGLGFMVSHVLSRSSAVANKAYSGEQGSSNLNVFASMFVPMS